MKIELNSIVYFTDNQFEENVGVVTKIISHTDGQSDYLVETYSGGQCWFDKKDLTLLTDEEIRYMLIDIIKDEPTKYKIM